MELQLGSNSRCSLSALWFWNVCGCLSSSPMRRASAVARMTCVSTIWQVEAASGARGARILIVDLSSAVSLPPPKKCIVHPGGPISKDKLIGRFDQFAAGHWGDDSRQSQVRAGDSFQTTTTKIYRPRCTPCPAWGTGRQALEGVELATGNRNTLDKLCQLLDVPRELILELPRDTPLFSLEEDVPPHARREQQQARQG